MEREEGGGGGGRGEGGGVGTEREVEGWRVRDGEGGVGGGGGMEREEEGGGGGMEREDGCGAEVVAAVSLQTAADGKSEDEGNPLSLAGGDKILDDAFLMVAQQPWENKILWETPYNPGPPISSIGGSGVGGQTRGQRLYITFVLIFLSPSGGVWTRADSTHLLSRQSSGDGVPSIFLVNNPALVYGHWEDSIIWDSEAVDQIPIPVVPRLDPNDPNIILGVPEEILASPVSRVYVCMYVCPHTLFWQYARLKV